MRLFPSCGSEEFVEDLRSKRRLSLVRTAVERIASRRLSRRAATFPVFYESNRLAGLYRKTLKERPEKRIVDIDLALRGKIDGGERGPKGEQVRRCPFLSREI